MSTASTILPANTTIDFPYIWNNDSNDALKNVFKNNYEEVKSKLLIHGVVLFKNYGVDTIEKFEDCVSGFPEKPLDYIDGNSPRTKLQGKVYTSTEHPAEAFISLHNELSYANLWPKHLFFCCEVPALEGGSTVIADSRKILNDLSGNTRELFVSKGVQYIRNLHGGFGAGPSWQDTFETSSKEEIEAYCKAGDIQWKWDDNENLRLIQIRNAVINHPETGESVWFNQADQFHPSTNSKDVYEALLEIYEDDFHSMPQYACFGDGTDIPMKILDEIREVVERNTKVFVWEKGDVMVVDNVLAAHGRTPFKGPRKILVSMSA